MNRTSAIPLADIQRIRLYLNEGKLTLEEIVAQEKPDYAITATFYNSNWTAACHLKAEGYIYADDPTYNAWGYSWDSPEDFALDLLPGSDKANYYTCCQLIRGGSGCKPLYYNADVGGARGRTAVGLRGDELILYACTDGADALTPEGLREALLAQGLDSAVMGDGGGKVNFYGPDGYIEGGAKSQNLLLIYLKKEGEKDMPEIEYLPITKSDVWSSTRTIPPSGIVLHSTAMPGYDAYAIQANFNRANRGASIHGCVDDKRIIQTLPWTKRAGHVGSGSKGSYNNSHIGIEMCEPTGLTYNSNGSVITAYNPPAGYFAAIWDNAVSLFAYLCQEYGLDPLGKNVIVCHSEAHALGYGDNHADVMHWFKWEGKTMDDFRQAVAAKMKGEDEEVTYEQFKAFMEQYLNEAVVSEPSGWAAESCQKAIDKGIMKGDGSGAYNFQKPLTREAYLVMQDRAGLL